MRASVAERALIDEHECFRAPQDRDAKLWRYTDLPKLLEMLRTKSLFFARSDTLGDPFEGSVPLPSSSEAMRAPLLGIAGMTPELTHRMILETSKRRSEAKDWMYCNCWHLNENESFAMWRLYTKADESICIRTTYSKLAAALPNKSFLGLINYRDYRSDALTTGNLFEAFMSKRRSFEHEREVRALVWRVKVEGLPPVNTLPENTHLTPDETGVIVPIDVDAVVEEIYVSPTSGSWFRDLVEDACAQYGLKTQVRQSDLSGQPVF